jgi:hypothetical protein
LLPGKCCNEHKVLTIVPSNVSDSVLQCVWKVAVHL